MQDGKKIKYNLIIGIASQVLTIVLGVVLPRLVLTNYGSEINGLINSITQIYTYIGLLEAGIGTATVQALYKTIGKNDRQATNAVLAATNRYYHKTGILYVLAILVFSVVYPFVVETAIPTVTITFIIVFNGAGSVISFFFQRKYLLLLQAEGKNYIESALTMLINVFKNVAKIVLMACGMDVITVQAIGLVVSIVQMVIITVYIRRNYKWIDLKVKPDNAAIAQSKNVMVHQLSTLIFNNTDSIILSVFCGLKVVSVYSLYNMLFGMIGTALSVVVNSIVFTMGQAFHTDKQKFMRLYDAFELCYMTLVFALYSVANFFILPFIKDKYLPLLMVVTYLLSCGRSAPGQAINIAGHFQKTQVRSIFESAINIIISLIAVRYLGIYGVLIGTIIALLYRSNDMIIYAHRNVLHTTVGTTYKRWIVNMAVFVGMLLANQYINVDLSSYTAILLWCVPYTMGTLVLFFGVAFLTNPRSVQSIRELLQAFIGKKLGHQKTNRM